MIVSCSYALPLAYNHLVVHVWLIFVRSLLGFFGGKNLIKKNKERNKHFNVFIKRSLNVF